MIILKEIKKQAGALSVKMLELDQAKPEDKPRLAAEVNAERQAIEQEAGPLGYKVRWERRCMPGAKPYEDGYTDYEYEFVISRK